MESLKEIFFTLSKCETEYIYCIHYNLEDAEFWYYDYIMALNVFLNFAGWEFLVILTISCQLYMFLNFAGLEPKIHDVTGKGAEHLVHSADPTWTAG